MKKLSALFFACLFVCMPWLTFAQPFYYKTKANGNFANAGTWLQSSDSLTWIDATAFPSGIALSVNIAHEVALNAHISVAPVYIAPNGTLSLGLFSLEIANASGIDLRIEGTLADQSPSSAGISFATNAKWQMGTQGTVIKTSNSGIAAYRDCYAGGISQIPATAHWIYRYTGAITPAVLAIDMYYPNLTFENASATAVFVPSSNIGAFKGGSGHCVVKGNLDIGGTTFANGYTVFNNNFAPNAMRVEGNLYVRQGSRLSNKKELAGTASSTKEGTGFSIGGNIWVDGTLEMVKSDSGSSDENTRSRIFLLNGTGLQELGGAGTFMLDFAHINNVGLSLASDFPIRKSLYLENGQIAGNGHPVLLGNAPKAGTLFRKNGAVEGKFARYFAPTTISDSTRTVFPLITANGQLKQIAIAFTQAPTEGGWLEASFESNSMGNSGLPIEATAAGTPKDLVAGAQEGYWKVQPQGGGLLDGAYTASIVALGLYSVADASYPTLLLKTDAFWQAHGQYSDAQPKADTLFVQRTGLQAWGNLGVAGGAAVLLPLSLLSFHGEIFAGKCRLSWETAYEVGITNFSIENSVNGLIFNELTRVEANGGGLYTLEISQENQQSYYRIRWQEADGTWTYSPIILVEGISASIISHSQIDRRKVESFSIYANQFEAALYNMSGAAQAVGVHSEEALRAVLAALPNGLYILRVHWLGKSWAGRVLLH